MASNETILFEQRQRPHVRTADPRTVRNWWRLALASGSRRSPIIALALIALLQLVTVAAGSAPAFADTGSLVWPVNGFVSTSAAEHRAAENGNSAIDIASWIPNNPVGAAASGVVVTASTGGNTECYNVNRASNGLGNYIVIKHSSSTGTTYTGYAHLALVQVTVNQAIAQGQQIGIMGQTGCAFGPHAHFTVSSCPAIFGCTLWNDPDLADNTTIPRGAAIANSAYPGVTAPAPPTSASTYAGHIVQWNGDQNAQKTAWLVGIDGRRSWVADAATYNCLKSFGAPGPDALSSAFLNQLPDQTGVRATCDQLSVGWTMHRGQNLYSVNGAYRLTFQASDGNLVLYSSSNVALWATFAGTAQFIAMQGDGNLVEYDSANRAVWNSATSGRSYSRLVVQSDGNLVMYNATKATWATFTSGGTNQLNHPSGYVL